MQMTGCQENSLIQSFDLLFELVQSESRRGVLRDNPKPAVPECPLRHAQLIQVDILRPESGVE